MTNPDTLLRAAKAAERQGEMGEARRLFEKIVEDHSDREEAKEAKAWLAGVRSSSLAVSPSADALQSAPQLVKVVDFDIAFGSLVWLMVKIVIAAIPAGIILFVIGAVVTAILAQLGYVL